MDYENMLKNRIHEYARRALDYNTYQFSKFHGMRSLDVYEKIKKEISFIDTSLYGGYELAERKFIVFGSERNFGYLPDIPIALLCIKPLSLNYADRLTHRDFLGAILNLGIDKGNIGDILVKGDNAYVFVLKPIDDFIKKNLSKVKHTYVSCEYIDEIPSDIVQKEMLALNVAGLRLDSIIAAITKLSRSEADNLIKSEKVFLDGLIAISSSKQLKPESQLAIRGYGRYKFLGINHITRKGRYAISVEKYL